MIRWKGLYVFSGREIRWPGRDCSDIIYIDDEYAETMNLDKSLKEIGITQYRIEKMQKGVAIYVQ